MICYVTWGYELKFELKFLERASLLSPKGEGDDIATSAASYPPQFDWSIRENTE